uniref:Uncharacterized protein n=1 Tax=Ciona intestinalis TaxID=7719 RepID=H2XKK5_CIOIN
MYFFHNNVQYHVASKFTMLKSLQAGPMSSKWCFHIFTSPHCVCVFK